MKHFISLSKFPGTTGTYFYNNFFRRYSFPGKYEAHECSDISKIRAWLPIVDGISISMPFKQSVLSYLEYVDSTVYDYDSCNTILLDEYCINGFNTDLKGVEYTCAKISLGMKVSILGNGSMANMYYKYLSLRNHVVTMYARGLNNWDSRHVDCDVVINCTGLGTIVPDSPLETLPKCSIVIDLALKDNVLSKQSKDITYVSGIEFYKQQFMEQFKLYTNINPDSEYFDYLNKNR